MSLESCSCAESHCAWSCLLARDCFGSKSSAHSRFGRTLLHPPCISSGYGLCGGVGTDTYRAGGRAHPRFCTTPSCSLPPPLGAGNQASHSPGMRQSALQKKWAERDEFHIPYSIPYFGRQASSKLYKTQRIFSICQGDDFSNIGYPSQMCSLSIVCTYFATESAVCSTR
jgi:hypothetical protein